MGLLLFAIIVAIYFLPTWVAYHRRHNNRLAIFVLDFFLGWTFVGWVAALVWAATADIDKSRRDEEPSLFEIERARWTNERRPP